MLPAKPSESSARGLRVGCGVFRWLACALLAVACYEGRSLDLFPVGAGTNGLACNEDSGCPRERPFCVLGSCVECASDGNCRGPKRACAGGACVTCATDEHCAIGEACNRAADRCVPRCAQPSDCAGIAEVRCDTERSFCVECLEGGDCTVPQRPACDDASGRCVACNSDSDCDVRAPVCDASRHACVECTDAQHCNGLTCNAERRCVECSGAEDCSAGARCDVMAGRCVADCANDDDCDPKHPRCRAQDGRCVECIERADCGDAKRPTCDATGLCVACLEDADCTEAGMPACISARQRCAQCVRDEQCPAAMSCDLRQALCVP